MHRSLADLGVWYKLPDSVWTYLAVTGTVYISGAGIAIYGGMYWKRASSAGAFAALCGGLLAISNFVICALLFVVFSLLFPDRETEKAEV